MSAKEKATQEVEALEAAFRRVLEALQEVLRLVVEKLEGPLALGVGTRRFFTEGLQLEVARLTPGGQGGVWRS